VRSATTAFPAKLCNSRPSASCLSNRLSQPRGYHSVCPHQLCAYMRTLLWPYPDFTLPCTVPSLTRLLEAFVPHSKAFPGTWPRVVKASYHAATAFTDQRHGILSCSMNHLQHSMDAYGRGMGMTCRSAFTPYGTRHGCFGDSWEITKPPKHP
jgi:hypothetical protein